MLRARFPYSPSLLQSNSKKSRQILLTKKAAQIAGVFLIVGALVAWLWGMFHDWNSVALPDENIGLKIYDRYNRPVCTLLHSKEFSPVPLKKVAKTLQQAIIAAEDHNFYYHNGISIESIFRALFVNLKAGHVVQGGSTLTQQLVKNLYFSDDKRTFLAKVKEAVMAVELNQRYSKDKILEAYLNYVYFGRGTFGIEQAAQKYFGSHADQLDLAQSAYLAGIVNAPSHLSTHETDAELREHEILDNMVKQHYITVDAAKSAKSEKLIFRGALTQQERYGYYLNHVVALLEEQYSQEQLWNHGLHCFTNLDPAAQALADRTLTLRIKSAPSGISQGALVSIAVKDGAVIAMVGGVGSFEKSPWDRALAPHTAGSAFKPFVYLAGLISGVIKPNSTIDDAPISINVPGTNQIYSPRNFENDYLGPITIRKALALSRNTCAVRVCQAVGPQQVATTAKKAGVTAKLDPALSIALGACAVTPLDMANSYATLVRSGIYMPPSFIRKLETKDGKLVSQYNLQGNQVFEAEPVAEIVDALQDVVQKGTGTRAQLFGRPVAGKTGTADGARDIWFIGFTPDMVTAVWGGNDKNQAIPGKQVTGGSVMAGIWQQYMQGYYNSHPTPPGSFALPANPVAAEADAIHYLPQPANIFDKLGHLIDPADFPPTAPAIPDVGTMPAVAPQPNQGFGVAPQRAGTVSTNAPSNPHANSDAPKPKGKVKRFFKRVFNLLDN